MEPADNKASNNAKAEKTLKDKHDSNFDPNASANCLEIEGANCKQNSRFDLNALLKSLEKIDSMKQMSLEELTSVVSEIGGCRLLFPRTKDEVQTFEKFIALWGQTVNKISKLASKIVELGENDEKSDKERILAQKLSIVNKSLKKIDLLLTEFCAVYQYFQLSHQDYLLLIYDPLDQEKKSAIRGIFSHNGEVNLLEPSSFPKELTDISSREHFINCLKNVHIQMAVDPRDPGKSTFSITPRLLGGIGFEDIFKFLKIVDNVILKIHAVITLSARLFRKHGIDVSDKEMRIALGGAAIGVGIGVGRTALMLGTVAVGPAVAIGLGLLLLLTKPPRRIAEEQVGLYDDLVELDLDVDDAAEILDEVERDRQEARRRRQERAQSVGIEQL